MGTTNLTEDEIKRSLTTKTEARNYPGFSHRFIEWSTQASGGINPHFLRQKCLAGSLYSQDVQPG